MQSVRLSPRLFEAEGIGYTIRPSSYRKGLSIQASGGASAAEVRRYFASFAYQAQLEKTPRVVAMNARTHALAGQCRGYRGLKIIRLAST